MVSIFHLKNTKIVVLQSERSLTTSDGHSDWHYFPMNFSMYYFFYHLLKDLSHNWRLDLYIYSLNVKVVQNRRKSHTVTDSVWCRLLTFYLVLGLQYLAYFALLQSWINNYYRRHGKSLFLKIFYIIYNLKLLLKKIKSRIQKKTLHVEYHCRHVWKLVTWPLLQVSGAEFDFLAR